MRRIIKNTADRLDRLNKAVGESVAWLNLGMVGVTFLIVILRYVFSLGWIWMQELVLYLHSMVFLLGAAYTLGLDGHVRVDIFYRKMGDRGRDWVDLLGTLFLLMPTCALIAYQAWPFVADSWAVFEGSIEGQGGIPLVFALKTLILIYSLLLFFQGLVLASRSAFRLLDGCERTEAG